MVALLSAVLFATTLLEPSEAVRSALASDPALAARMAPVYAQKYWIAWLGLFKPNAERVRAGKTLIVKVLSPT